MPHCHRTHVSRNHRQSLHHRARQYEVRCRPHQPSRSPATASAGSSVPIIGSVFFYGKDSLGHSTGSQTLYIPYAVIAVVVIVLAAIFSFANVPDIKTEDDYHLDDAAAEGSHSIWKHPHFVMAVAAQFFYVAAQAGIFSFFINYMTAEVPAIPVSWSTAMSKSLRTTLAFFKTGCSVGSRSIRQALWSSATRAASNLAAVGFVFFLVGRFTGPGCCGDSPRTRCWGCTPC